MYADVMVNGYRYWEEDKLEAKEEYENIISKLSNLTDEDWNDVFEDSILKGSRKWMISLIERDWNSNEQGPDMADISDIEKYIAMVVTWSVLKPELEFKLDIYSGKNQWEVFLQEGQMNDFRHEESLDENEEEDFFMDESWAEDFINTEIFQIAEDIIDYI